MAAIKIAKNTTNSPHHPTSISHSKANPNPTPNMSPKPPPLTHFLSIPLVTPASFPKLASKLAAFRADPAVCNAIPPDAIRPLGTLHLTLGVMSFPSALSPSVAAQGQESGPERLARARALLKEIPLRFLWRAAGRVAAGKPAGEEQPGEVDEPIKVRLRGLRTMTPGREEASGVLYAGVEDGEGGRVHIFCEAVRRAFEREGLVVEDGRGLVLHATVVNTIYCLGRGKGKKGGRVKVDAREVMERWGGEEWVEGGIEVEEVAICKMGAKRVEGEEGVVEEGRLGQVYEVVETNIVKDEEEESSSGGWLGIPIPNIFPF